MKIGTFIIIAAQLLILPTLQGQAAGQQPQPGKAPQDCQAVMAAHRQMMKEMEQMDLVLQQKLQAMNAATDEDRKIRAMADVINEMVRQRREMREQMTRMQMNMMNHMTGHMSSAQGMQGMANCPMMQEMQQKSEQPPQPSRTTPPSQ